MQILEWNIKCLQEVTLTGTGPQVGSQGWHPAETALGNLTYPEWMPLWSGTSPALQASLMQAYTQAWFTQASSYTPQQYYQGGWANPHDDPSKLPWGTFGNQLWYSVPKLRSFGIDQKLADQITAWAATLWPQANWRTSESARSGF
jgi:hypothetical protein